MKHLGTGAIAKLLCHFGQQFPITPLRACACTPQSGTGATSDTSVKLKADDRRGRAREQGAGPELPAFGKYTDALPKNATPQISDRGFNRMPTRKPHDPPRKRGGQPKNLNAMKHGRRSRQKQAERQAEMNARHREWMAQMPPPYRPWLTEGEDK